MKYVANGKIITEEEANAIRTRNDKLLNMFEKTGDFNCLMDAVFVLPLALEMELAKQ